MDRIAAKAGCQGECFVAMIARHVNRKSFEVMGRPSLQTAFGSRWYVIRKGGPRESPPFSRLGASVRRKEATGLSRGSSCMALGRTCSKTVHHPQSGSPHSMTTLTQFGHCSAPITIEPPQPTPHPGRVGGLEGRDDELDEPVQAASRLPVSASDRS